MSNPLPFKRTTAIDASEGRCKRGGTWTDAGHSRRPSAHGRTETARAAMRRQLDRTAQQLAQREPPANDSGEFGSSGARGVWWFNATPDVNDDRPSTRRYVT